MLRKNNSNIRIELDTTYSFHYHIWLYFSYHRVNGIACEWKVSSVKLLLRLYEVNTASYRIQDFKIYDETEILKQKEITDGEY